MKHMRPVIGYRCIDCRKKIPLESVGEHGEVTGHKIYHPIFERMRFQVGDIVKIINCADAGKYGYIYDVYERHDTEAPVGYSVLTNTDQDLGGFSGEEADEFFEYVRHSGVAYQFENVTKLAADRQRGYFATVFTVKLGECGFPEKCQKAEQPDCDCSCGGAHHGTQIKLLN
jgi:hypothetical protein